MLNPYAATDVNDVPISTAERDIRSVVRSFKLLGWFGLIFSISQLIYTLFVRQFDPGIFMWAACMFMALSSAVYLSIARSLEQEDPKSLSRARVASYCIIAGLPPLPASLVCFPVFVLLGLVCARKVSRYSKIVQSNAEMS
jgi:hypothetical protein